MELSECRPDHKHVVEYSERCRAFEAFCKAGITTRPNTAMLRESISRVIHLPPSNLTVSAYAEDIRIRGYTHADVENVTMESVDAICSSWKEGHKEKLVAKAKNNMSPLMRICTQFGIAWDKCGHNVVDVARLVFSRE